MRIKQVNRYWCDYCKKASLSSGAMRKHESRCTLNPNRTCRMCDFVGGSSKPDLAALIALLPDQSEFRSEFGAYGRDWDDAINAALPALREASGNCPCCIMAALRQRKILLPTVEAFNFSAECKAIFETVNEEKHQAELERERHYI